MHGRATLALAALAFAAAARAPAAGADDAVVVIRGSDVSVARPLTPERVRDGSTEVEIVRVEVAPAPAARARRPQPEREVVVVLLPAAPAPPLGIPVVWTTAWPWPRWPGSPAHRPHGVSQRRGHFLPGLHLAAGPGGALRSGLRSR